MGNNINNENKSDSNQEKKQNVNEDDLNESIDNINHPEFYCTITMEIMKDPVIIADGSTFEREAIVEWFKNSDLSPNTGIKVPHKNLVTNYALKSLIERKMENIRKNKGKKTVLQSKRNKTRLLTKEQKEEIEKNRQ